MPARTDAAGRLEAVAAGRCTAAVGTDPRRAARPPRPVAGADGADLLVLATWPEDGGGDVEVHVVDGPR